MAEELRRRVREDTRLTCSCGVAPNRLLAKIASDLNKPDGQYVMVGDADAVAQFMAQLPIRKVPGIGKARPAKTYPAPNQAPALPLCTLTVRIASQHGSPNVLCYDDAYASRVILCCS